MTLEWKPDPTAKRMTGAIVSGIYSIYELRPGQWRATFGTARVLCSGVSLEDAKKRCDQFAIEGK